MNNMGNFSLKATALSLQLSFIICFATSIFLNTPVREEKFNSKSWHYINRGIPWSWAGVSKVGYSVDFPIIKAPLINKRAFNGDSYSKIIDLKILSSMFLVLFIFAYPFGLIFSKAVDEHKDFNRVLIFMYIFFTATSLFVYFFWFPRI